ncbi:hypothetical protein ACFEMC_22600 [Kineococcus sp. DHX-1]|uniref:hypothetical protein n=1 Tax=Kineococcus sp. DHX-1 TaxID=3349638 RepID=UPI0036D351E7
MDGPATGGVRALRTAVVTVVVLALAVLAHVAGGGHVPSGPAAGAAVVAVALVAHVATRRQLTTAALLALLGAGQFVLHHVFMALDAARGPVDATAMPMATPGHGHPVALLAVLPEGSAGASGLAVGVDLGPVVLTPMLASHVVATLLTAVALAGGERALWRLWAWLVPLVVALSVRCTVVAVRLARASADGEHRPVHEAVLARVLPRRGPPVAAAR